MIYQLPNGKVIHLTVEQYLDLTDEDIEYMMSINFGDYARSPFHGSAIFKQKRKKKQDENTPEEVDKSLDYSEETEDLPSRDRVILSEEISPEDTPDLEDFSPEED